MENTQAKEPTYVTVRLNDRQPKNEGGKVSKNVQNFFFNGGTDSRKLPVLSSDKYIVLIGEKSGRMNVYKAERGEDGKSRLLVVDGQVQKPVFSRSVEKVLRDAKTGLNAKSLEVGQSAISGPDKDKLIKMLEGVAAKATAEREAARAAKAAEAPEGEGTKPARRKP